MSRLERTGRDSYSQAAQPNRRLQQIPMPHKNNRMLEQRQDTRVSGAKQENTVKSIDICPTAMNRPGVRYFVHLAYTVAGKANATYSAMVCFRGFLICRGGRR